MSIIDIKKIMAEVDEEVARRRVANKYKKDLKLLEELGKIELKDNSLYDLKMQSYHTKTIQLPRSLKKGFVSRFSNKLILKLYFVIGKMFDNSLRIQQKINSKLIDEVIEIKKNLGFVDLDHFPYAEFKKAFPVRQEVFDNTLEILRNVVHEGMSIVDLNATNSKFLSGLGNFHPKNQVAVNRNIQELSQVDVPEAVKVENRELFEFLSNSSIAEFDLIILQDMAEYLSLNYLITLIKEAYRTLEKEGVLVIRTLNPRNEHVIHNTFDPKLQRLLHPEMSKFLLSYYGFGDIEIIENNSGMEEYYVAIAKKH